MNVLIYDDDEMFLGVLTRYIKVYKQGVNLFKALDSKKALATLVSEKIDLLILDGHCPKGCEVGMTAMSMKVRVVICTGDPSYESIEFKEILFKPFSLEDIEHFFTPSSQS
jgi:response regulator of citrate/malate metabolism